MREVKPEVIVIEEYAVPDMPRGRARSSRITSHVAGVAATLLFHLLLTAPLLLGVSAHTARPRSPVGPGSVAWESQGTQSESMILLDLSALSADQRSEQIAPDIKADGIEIDERSLVLASHEISPPPDLAIDDAEEAENSNEAAGDPAGAAALFGRYMGQVSARIERTWMRPRAPVANGRFDCQARLTQDKRGNILSIEFQDCTSDDRWRESLRSAIRRASPISTPSEQWLFASSITLRFSAEQYLAGKTPEYLFEPQPKTLARSRPSLGVPTGLDGEGDLELTIEGSEVKWRKRASASSDKQLTRSND